MESPLLEMAEPRDFPVNWLILPRQSHHSGSTPDKRPAGKCAPAALILTSRCLHGLAGSLHAASPSVYCGPTDQRADPNTLVF